MKLHISTSNGIPIYLQIVQQLKYLIASERLKEGEALPPIRTLAQDLIVNPNTVARAYRELESLGMVTSRQGSGTRVSANGSPLARDEKRRILKERIDGLELGERRVACIKVAKLPVAACEAQALRNAPPALDELPREDAARRLMERCHDKFGGT